MRSWVGNQSLRLVGLQLLDDRGDVGQFLVAQASQPRRVERRHRAGDLHLGDLAPAALDEPREGREAELGVAVLAQRDRDDLVEVEAAVAAPASRTSSANDSPMGGRPRGLPDWPGRKGCPRSWWSLASR